jgi:apolipoprotein D and lipocalin family protein
MLLLPLLMSFLAPSQATLTTVPNVDLKRYAGTWYEIASYPNRFQKGCTCTTATYSPDSKGKVIVENRCNRNDKRSYVKGSAAVVPNSSNAKLKVSFFWPFSGKYWIIDLADDYSYSVVSNPSMKYLWILFRDREMDPATLASIKDRLKAKGFDLSKLQMTKQDCQ